MPSHTRKEVEKKVLAVFEEFFNAEAGSFKRDLDLKKDLDLDSFGQSELVLEIETYFDIRLDEEEMGNIENIGQAIDCVIRYLRAK